MKPTETDDTVDVTRLSVNINEDCAAILRNRMSADGINATEAIRRALSVWEYWRTHRMLAELKDGSLVHVATDSELATEATS